MNDKDKNCGTCCWRIVESQQGKFHDYRMPTETYEINDIWWVCNNSKSDKYCDEVSDPHGYCDAWEE